MPHGEVLQHISVGVVLVVAAALTPAVAGQALSCNTCGVTTRFGSLADLLEPSRRLVCPCLDPQRRIRFFKQVLGWTRPKLRDPAAADRWTWLIIAAYAQLRLARHLAADLRLPWQQPCPPGQLTPARVRRGFRSIRQTLPALASAPKPGQPGPGRPPGSKNRHPATRHDVGKTVKRAGTLNDPRKRLNNKLRPTGHADLMSSSGQQHLP
jgi:hypothetical protein